MSTRWELWLAALPVELRVSGSELQRGSTVQRVDTEAGDGSG